MSAPTYAGKVNAVQTLPTWQKNTFKIKGFGTNWEEDLESKGNEKEK